MKRILSLILAAMLLVLMASCGGGGNSGAGNTGGGNNTSANIITINLGGGTPLSIDPALNTAVNGSNILKLACAGLMGWQWENGKAVLKPELAESYTISDDKLTYTFTLREGLKWSDGSEFKASDILYSWNRTVNPELAAEYGYMYDVVDGYDEANPQLNISADDAARTFTAVLSAPTPYFLELTAHPSYFPVKEGVADSEGTWATNPDTYIGMGPFKMTKYAVDDMISFERNPNYWNASKVILDGVNCILSEDNAANLTSFETGASLFITQPDPGEYDRLKSTYGSQLVFGDYIGTYFIQFNVYKDLSPVGGPALSANDQAKARTALAHLINRVELVETVTRGGQAPAEGFVPHMSDGFNDDFRKVAPGYFQGTNTPSTANSKYTADQVLGMEALIALGYKYNGSIAGGDFSLTNFPAIEYSLNFAGANKAIIEYVQEIWGGFGITVTVNGEAWATLQTKVRDGGFDASRMGWIADYNDAINFLDMFVGISGNNHTRLGKDSGIYTGDTSVTGDFGLGAYWGRNHNQTWADAYEALIRDTKIDASLTLEQRAEKLQEAEWVLLDAGAVCPIYYYTNVYMLSNRVHDVMILNTGDIIWTYASFTA